MRTSSDRSGGRRLIAALALSLLPAVASAQSVGDSVFGELTVLEPIAVTLTVRENTSWEHILPAMRFGRQRY
jgi:hypothetical protein